jgi:SAM-dependent methyltransferase
MKREQEAVASCGVAGNSEFDKFADSYRDCVNSTLGPSGEDSEYFARGRVAWLKTIFKDDSNIHQVMDYGCGIGLGVPHLLTLPQVESVIGVDVSEKSLEHARANFGSERVQFSSFADRKPAADIDLAVCCSVFHHIPLEDRELAVKYIYDSLRPGGQLALFEHNPWNPGVVYIMNHSPIDQDAIRVKPQRARRMLSEGGFSILRTDYLFVFPGFLKIFRGLEPFLSRWAVGAQYLVLARKDK